MRSLLLSFLSFLLLAAAPAAADVLDEPLPPTLSATGLYADLGSGRIAPGVVGFTPQYPLWSDGSTKQRWVRLPPGARIDARHADAWDFPPGTRLWKEFSMGRRVETRMIERLADGRWRTRVTVRREGEAWMPVTLRVGAVEQRLTDRAEEQVVEVVTASRPTEVVVDPEGVLIDLDPTNNRAPL